MTIIFLCVSIAVNIVLIRYLRQYNAKITQEFLAIEERFVAPHTEIYNNLDILCGFFGEYEEHLSYLTSLEMFHGEPTLEKLAEHTKFILKELKDYRNKTDFAVPVVIVPETEDGEGLQEPSVGDSVINAEE